MGPLYHMKRIQDTIHQNSSFVTCSDKNESILPPVSQRRDRKPSQQTGSGKGTESGNSRLLFGFYFRIFLVPKKNRKLRLIIDLSLLNRYIEKQAFKMETVKSVRQAMRLNDWAVSIDLTDAYLHVPIHQTQRLGCLHRLNRCIPTRADTSSIRYIEKQAFKMETVKSVRQAMRLNDWAVSIDLTDAYLHVPIHQTQRLGCLHRLNRCIPTRADTSSIQEVSSHHTRRSSISLFGPTVRNVR